MKNKTKTESKLKKANIKQTHKNDLKKPKEHKQEKKSQNGKN